MRRLEGHDILRKSVVAASTGVLAATALSACGSGDSGAEPAPSTIAQQTLTGANFTETRTFTSDGKMITIIVGGGNEIAGDSYYGYLTDTEIISECQEGDLVDTVLGAKSVSGGYGGSIARTPNDAACIDGVLTPSDFSDLDSTQP